MSFSIDKVTPLLPGEEFRPHPVWPFDVSNLGRARSQRTGRFVSRLRGTSNAVKNRQKAQAPYVLVSVAGPPTRDVGMHILVLETFVGQRPDGHEGDHIDHDRLNNQLTNLRWRSLAENRVDVIR